MAATATAASQKVLVFVYGTLKRSFPNHALFMKEGTRFLATAVTTEKFPLVTLGDYHIPFLLDLPGQGFNVAGELFEVQANLLSTLDRLELTSERLYKRKNIVVKCSHVPENFDPIEAGSSDYLAYTYFKDSVQEQTVQNSSMLEVYPLPKSYSKASTRVPNWVELYKQL